MTRLHHIALGARDPERVAAFYAALFNLPVIARHHYADGRLRSVWLKAEAVIVMIEHTDAPPRTVHGVGAGLFLPAFAVAPEAHAAFAERLAAAGGAVEARSPFSLYFRDPEGNRAAVSSWPDAADPAPPDAPAT